MPKECARLPGSISEERRRKLCRAIERLERGSTTGTPGEFDAWNFLRVSSGFRPRALVSAFEKLPASCPRTAWSLRRHERKVVTTSVITSVTMSTPTSPPTSPPASTTWAIECQVCRRVFRGADALLSVLGHTALVHSAAGGAIAPPVAPQRGGGGGPKRPNLEKPKVADQCSPAVWEDFIREYLGGSGSGFIGFTRFKPLTID